MAAPPPVPLDPPPPPEGVGASVEVDGLWFGYEPGQSVLRGVDLTVAAGQRLGVLGPSGSGKSTLLLHLNGLLSGRQGEVRIDGRRVERDSLPHIRQQVGLVFQNPDDQLFCPTVEEDVAFGPLNLGLPRAEAAARTAEALAAVGLTGTGDRPPHHLSFGERKRAALATVLAMNPRVIALDEPFSNLDPAMVRQLMGLVAGLPATVVVVSQAVLPALALCHRVAVLVDGRVEAVGTPAEVAADRALLKRAGLEFDFYGAICRRFGR